MIKWELPITIVSEANCTEHWSKKAQRHRQQQFLIRCLFRHNGMPISLPCTVKMVRMAIRDYDDDNLVSAFKWIRDEISECLIEDSTGKFAYEIPEKTRVNKAKGRRDSDPRIKWEYAQEKSKNKGIRIEIHF